jgi:hypothetical protein
MRALHYAEWIFGTILLSACGSIICGCDMIEPGECLAAGEMFGPCREQACGPGLLCMATTQGSICTPELDVIGTPEAESCALWRGTYGLFCSEEWDLCYIPCQDDTQCIGGTVCAEDWEMCVYPR